MIPLRLKVKNFMCYGSSPQILEFSGIHLACLCGSNGHGKTALLDAITWALWGHTRTRTQEELVHQGQLDMSVELDFSARAQKYKVIRRYSRSSGAKQGVTILELQVAYSSENYQAITQNTLRETEHKIKELLNLDYDTFINTAFLRQGDADRFTTSRPAERKTTLAEVLGLSEYEKIELKAKAKYRTLTSTLKDFETKKHFLEEEISEKVKYENELTEIDLEIYSLETNLTKTQNKFELLNNISTKLNQQEAELKEAESQLTKNSLEIENLIEQLDKHNKTYHEIKELLLDKDQITKGYLTLNSYKSTLNKLDKDFEIKVDLDRKIANVNAELNIKKTKIMTTIDQLEAQLKNNLIPKTRNKTEIEEKINQLLNKEQEWKLIHSQIESLNNNYEKTNTKISDLKAFNQVLLNQMEDDRKKFDMLKISGGKCPLCQQKLDNNGHDILLKNYTHQGLTNKQNYQKNLENQNSLITQNSTLKTQINFIEKKLSDDQQHVNTSIIKLKSELTDSIKAEKDINISQNEINALENSINSNNYAGNDIDKLEELNEQLNNLNYSTELHSKVKSQIIELSSYEEKHIKLKSAETLFPKEESLIKSTKNILENRKIEKELLSNKIINIKAELEKKEDITLELNKINNDLSILKPNLQNLYIKKGILTDNIARCAKYEKELNELNKQVNSISKEADIFNELSLAFGKNGLQALIIETSIPQLEQDSNQLLSRLSENKMAIKFQLVAGRKDSRTGMVSEELDIKVSDEVGTRNYETFSGGEAFRINFAIRIALSRLLARRSGAPLPILFIDEGFGSQDFEGQEKLIQSIQSIQNDFEKIIVITHIEQIKDSFPVRIEVTKSGEGSTLEVY
tara:strand:+ start:13947 stop:16526 length:2580 start_codon:yes stop_codon:yes gene_type:complete